jgi:hypothetical protein
MKMGIHTRGEQGKGDFGRTIELPAVPRAGDVVWMDDDPDKPSMTRFFVRRVDWFVDRPVHDVVLIVSREP